MKLSKRIKNEISHELILRTNELYHDFEHELYLERHNNMFTEERIKWEELSEEYIKREQNFTALDYGSGTGFVPMSIGNKLKKGDTLICTDLSEKILKVCESNLNKKDFNCNIRYEKIDGINIPVNDNVLDVITINSVLHHVYDLSKFSDEVFRCLKPGGVLIVVHEPNADAKLHFPYNGLISFFKFTIKPQLIFFYMTERIYIVEKLLRKILSKMSPSYNRRNKMLEAISIKLLDEKLINFKLRGTEIQQLVDIHTENGFYKETILKKFSKLKLLKWDTYNFIGGNNVLSNKINAKMKNKYPLKGETLLFVLKK